MRTHGFASARDASDRWQASGIISKRGEGASRPWSPPAPPRGGRSTSDPGASAPDHRVRYSECQLGG